MCQQKLWNRIKEGLSETIVRMDPNFLLELAPEQLEILVVCLGDLMGEGEKWTDANRISYVPFHSWNQRG